MKTSEAFIYAAKNKLRFTSTVGSLSVEDIASLPLTSARGVSLDSVSVILLEEKAKSPKMSMVTENKKSDEAIEAKTLILETFIKLRRKEQKVKEEEAKRNKQRKLIADALEEQEKIELIDGKSSKELKKLLKELQ